MQHPALVLALRGVLSSREEDESKKHASGTLMVLERTITPEMESCYEILKDLLHAVNPSPASDDDGDNKNDCNADSNNHNDNGNNDACSELSDVVNATAV